MLLPFAWALRLGRAPLGPAPRGPSPAFAARRSLALQPSMESGKPRQVASSGRKKAGKGEAPPTANFYRPQPWQYQGC
eukprot:12234002-Alexandrium_andersonii.AAC.1